MKFVLYYASPLLFLCTLFQKTFCIPVEENLEKRINPHTELYRLCHDEQSEDFNTISTSDDEPYDHMQMWWETEENRAIATTYGDLLLSVQTNVGGWLCGIQNPLWIKMDRQSHSAEELYQKLWVHGCRESLEDKLKDWKAVLGGIHGAPELEIYGVQAFALMLSTKKPNGYKARSVIIPDLKKILGIKYIPLMGWPVLQQSSRQSSVLSGFVVVQEPVQRSDELGNYAIMKIYATGTGPSEYGNRQNPFWGTHPAIEMMMYDGFLRNDCQDRWIFQKAKRLDNNGDIFPDAMGQKDLKDPYTFLDTN